MYNIKQFNEKLSDTMKEYRKKKGYTQKGLSEEVNIDVKYIQKLESKKILIEPRLKTLSIIASSFGINLLTLLKKTLKDNEWQDNKKY